MLKSRFIKFMVANLAGKNKYVAYVANICFRNAISSSGRNINKIILEYKLDYRLLQLPHVFNIKANMDIMYKDTISAPIHGEDWKINMILESVDCLIKWTLWKRLYIWWKYVFIIRYLYHMIYQYQIFYIILFSQPL